jgi:hypothetical protein
LGVLGNTGRVFGFLTASGRGWLPSKAALVLWGITKPGASSAAWRERRDAGLLAPALSTRQLTSLNYLGVMFISILDEEFEVQRN